MDAVDALSYSHADLSFFGGNIIVLASDHSPLPEHGGTGFVQPAKELVFFNNPSQQSSLMASHQCTTEHCSMSMQDLTQSHRARNLRIRAETCCYPMPPCLSSSAQKTNSIFSLFGVAESKTFPRRDADPWVAHLTPRSITLPPLAASQGAQRHVGVEQARPNPWGTVSGCCRDVDRH